MLNRYIEFLKKLTESVFEIKGVGSIGDYFEAVWRGFLLLLLIILTVAGIVAIVVGPFVLWKWVWKKLSAKHVDEINRLWKENTKEAIDRMHELSSKLDKIKRWYITGLVVVHVPFVMPLIMMLIDFIM